MALPKMVRIKQHIEAPIVENIPAAVQAELDQIDAASLVKNGDRIAITGGSRGVANIDVVIKATVDYLKQLGAETFRRTGNGKPRRSNRGGTARCFGALRYHRRNRRCAYRSHDGHRGDRQNSRWIAGFA